MAALKLKKRKIPGAGTAIVVQPEGDLVAGTCTQFERFLEEVFADRVRGLAVDLTKVAFMSSAALGVLIDCVGRMQERKGWFGLIAANDVVRSSIEVLGLADYLQLCASLDDLLAKSGVERPRRRATTKRTRRKGTKK